MNGVNEELASADKRFLLHALEKEREEKSKGVEMSFFFPPKYGIEPISVTGMPPRAGDVVYFRQYGDVNVGRDPFAPAGMSRWKVRDISFSVTCWNPADKRYILTPNGMRAEVRLKRYPFWGFYRTRRVLRSIRNLFRNN
jgi:hypothetical protein